MDSQIYQAISAAPEDYMVRYQRVASLCKMLALKLGLPLQHVSMDYSSERIVLELDSMFLPVPLRTLTAQYRIETFVSFRGNLFTSLVYQKARSDAWTCIEETSVLNPIRVYKEQIQAAMETERYIFVGGSLLSDLVPGAVTQLDGLPATVFNVLFGEMDL